MRRILELSLAAAALAAPAAEARGCKNVPLTPNSDHIATNVRAIGLTCGLARDFIRDSDGTPRQGFRGFRCTTRDVDSDGLPYVKYRCTGAGDVIAWHQF